MGLVGNFARGAAWPASSSSVWESTALSSWEKNDGWGRGGGGRRALPLTTGIGRKRLERKRYWWGVVTSTGREKATGKANGGITMEGEVEGVRGGQDISSGSRTHVEYGRRRERDGVGMGAM